MVSGLAARAGRTLISGGVRGPLFQDVEIEGVRGGPVQLT